MTFHYQNWGRKSRETEGDWPTAAPASITAKPTFALGLLHPSMLLSGKIAPRSASGLLPCFTRASAKLPPCSWAPQATLLFKQQCLPPSAVFLHHNSLISLHHRFYGFLKILCFLWLDYKEQGLEQKLTNTWEDSNKCTKWRLVNLVFGRSLVNDQCKLKHKPW